MMRIALFTLLMALNGLWLPQAQAQSPGVAEYARTSRERDKQSAKQQKRLLKKASKKQRKAMKKYVKAQRKAAAKANRRSR